MPLSQQLVCITLSAFRRARSLYTGWSLQTHAHASLRLNARLKSNIEAFGSVPDSKSTITAHLPWYNFMTISVANMKLFAPMLDSSWTEHCLDTGTDVHLSR